MPAIFLLIIGLYLIGNLYIYFRGLHTIAHFPASAKIVLSMLFWGCALSLILTFMLRKANLSVKLMTFMHETGSIWLVFTLYMVLFLLSFDLIRLFYKPFNFGFQLAFVFTLCLLGYGYYNYMHPKTTHVDITIKKQAATAAVKIVAISDVHLGLGTGKAMLKEYVGLINKQKPDLVLISGDLIDNDVTPLISERMREELEQIQAPLGIFMVPGNHEYIAGIDESVGFINSTPIRLLRDSVAVLPNGIQIVGRDDRHNRRRMPLGDLLKKTDPAKPVILLDHQPYKLDETVRAGIDLQFSGHTHRGQIWPVSLLTDSMFEISYGYEKRINTHLYVSSGLSLWGPPLRIGTDSELVVFNIQFQ